MHKFFTKFDHDATLNIKRRYPPKVLGDSTNMPEQPDAHDDTQNQKNHHEALEHDNSIEVYPEQTSMNTSGADSIEQLSPIISTPMTLYQSEDQLFQLNPDEHQIMVAQPYEGNRYLVDMNQNINAPRQVLTLTNHYMYDYTDLDVWMTFPELTNELTLEELASTYSRSYVDSN